jgi:CelD/BcsL family acetyltransferase involved in cellulose biosynthesis
MHAPLDPTSRVEWRGLSALEDLTREWRALAKRAVEPNAFYEPAFLSAAAPAFGTQAGTVLVWSGGRLIGLFPLRIARGPWHPIAMTTGWTHSFAPLGTPLVDRDHADAAIAICFDHLAGDPTFPGLLLMPLLPVRGAFAAALDAVLARNARRSAALSRHSRALLEPGTQRAGYLERSITARRRKELRRLRRRLAETAPVTFTTTTAAGEIGGALQDFLTLEASGWKGSAGTAAGDDPAIRNFVQNAVANLAAEGRVRIDRLLLDGRAIAASIALRSGDVAWLWKTAYDESLAQYSPGVQLTLDATESLLAGPEIARVDSCAIADHPMIDHIWRERLPLSDRLIELRPSRMPFAFVCQVENTRRAAVALAKALRNRLRSR